VKAIQAANADGCADYATLRRRYVRHMWKLGFAVNYEFAGVHVSNDRYVVQYPPSHDVEPVTILAAPVSTVEAAAVGRKRQASAESDIWYRELTPISDHGG